MAAKRIAEALTGLGIAVLRFDFTGLGASEGEFANTTFSSNVADLVAAADHLRRTQRAPALLIGHSLGGAAVLAAAAARPRGARRRDDRARRPIRRHVAGLFEDARADHRAQRRGRGDARRAAPSASAASFLDDVAEQQLSGRIDALHKALLILHSPHRRHRRHRQCRAASSPPPGIPRASSRSPAPTTCSAAAATRPTWRT